jgi:taurine dioxygenase
MIAVTTMSAPLGAEITGIDLSLDIDKKTFDRIVEIFHEHAVIVFRGQNLTSQQHAAFSRRFGDLWTSTVQTKFNKPDCPEVLILSNILKDGQPIGVRDAGPYWHTDLCFLPRPSRATMLHAKEIPVQDGVALGDTIFSSVTAAYDALPAEMKSRLAGLKAVHSYNYTYEQKVRDFKLRNALKTDEKRWMPEDVLHPVVRTHPFTGRKGLYVNEAYTTHIVGIPKAESDAILKQLFEHVTRPEFTYRHKWQVGDFLMWDNCPTQHKAVMDYALPLRRLMERTTVVGEATF